MIKLHEAVGTATGERPDRFLTLGSEGMEFKADL
jgi:hypothetical protein